MSYASDPIDEQVGAAGTGVRTLRASEEPSPRRTCGGWARDGLHVWPASRPPCVTCQLSVDAVAGSLSRRRRRPLPHALIAARVRVPAHRGVISTARRPG